MIIGVPKEVHDGERRVALAPEHVKELLKLGYNKIIVESGAGERASFSDDMFKSAGAEVVSDASRVWKESDLVIKVRPLENHPTLRTHELELLKVGGAMISFVWPAINKDILPKLAAKKATVLAMDMVPRITRAQKMDALSSMANIAGYRAVIEAASHFGSFFTGQITAAGKIAPAKVLIIGAGVAGLAAIGAARSLGAIVRAFDTRPEVRDQVKSMGAEFLEVKIQEDGTGVGGYAKVMSPEFIKAEMELFAQQAKDVDIIITTALIPGVKAPTLITEDMVRSMKRGSVVVDMAAEQGGNCAVTRPGEVVEVNGVKVIGYTDLASRLSTQSSKLYGTNVCHLLKHIKTEDKVWIINMEDEIVRGSIVVHNGEITFPPPKPKVAAAPAKPSPAAAPTPVAATKPASHGKGHGAPSGDGKFSYKLGALMILAALFMGVIGHFAPSDFLAHLTVFVLACFIGYMVIWNVTPALHTPLMSVTNAISGIIVIGGMLQISGPIEHITTILAALAVFLATINVSGGFLVTRRMLKMFRK